MYTATPEAIAGCAVGTEKCAHCKNSCHASLYKNPRKRGKTTKDYTYIATLTPQTVKIRFTSIEEGRTESKSPH